MQRAAASRLSERLRARRARARRRARQRAADQARRRCDENVWWINRANFAFPDELDSSFAYKKRQVDFAWGPRAIAPAQQRNARVHGLRRAGRQRRGLLRRSDVPRAPAVAGRSADAAGVRFFGTARSASRERDRRRFRDVWQSARGGEQSLTLDLGLEREFGGVVLHWHGDAFASKYEVALSDDAKDWRIVRRGDGRQRRRRSALSAGIRSTLRSHFDARARGTAMRSTRSSSRISRSARPRTRSSRRSRNRRRAAGIRAASTTSRRTGPSSASTAGTKRACSPKMARSKSRAAAFPSRRSSRTRTARRRHGPMRRSRTRSPTDICRFRALSGSANDFALTTTAFAAGKRGASMLIARYVLREHDR